MSASSVAHSIADNIVRFGHFQEPNSGPLRTMVSLNGSDNPAGLCCLIANPTMREVSRGDGRFSQSDRDDFFRALAQVAGFEESLVGPVEWSNDTPTSEVIATLRSM